MSTETRPFDIDIPEETLDDLRRRLAATRWPSKELVADPSQGVQLSAVQALCRYWLDGYDFREIWRTPRSCVEASYPNVVYVNEVDKGGHFAAWEEPELFSNELRAAFRSLR